jgi:SAM-dependent methyltransferase
VGPCPACGAALSPWITVPAGEPADTRRFDLARCASCGTAVTAGPPPGPDAYEQGVYSPESARPAVAALLQRATVGQPARALARSGLRPGARVLDAGAGRGRLVAELRRRGFDAYGIDPSARQAGGAVRRQSIAGHEDAGLDAVVLWHVAEHLDDPLAALERVRGWLAPGGLVLLGVPNAASAQARLAGPAWMHWDTPRHRQHFTPAGVSALLGRAGFSPTRTEHMVWEHNPASMWMAMLSRLGVSPAYAFHALKGNAPRRGRDLRRTLAGVPLLPVALAAEAAAAAARRGGTLIVVARA